jgi:DNA-binding MarR family transcriptional regulator
MPPSPDVSLLAQQILEVLPLAMRTLAFDLRRSEHVLATPHFRLLWVLNHRPFTLSELAEHLFVSLPTMSNSISTLEARGWVTRVRSETDRRRIFIQLSSAGRQVLDEVQREMEARVVERLSALSESDRQVLQEGLLVLRHAFASAEACPPRETADTE